MALLKFLQLSEPTPSIRKKQKVMLGKIASTPGNRKQRKQNLGLFFSPKKQSRDKEAALGPLLR